MTSSRTSFARLVDLYYRSWFRFHPETAVDVGVSGYEQRLTPYADDDLGALVALNEKLLASLDEIDPTELDEDRQLDHQVLYGAALIELEELRESDWRYHDPCRYLPVHAVHQLFMRPVADFRSAFVSRVGQIPEYLRGARAHLGETPELVPEPWLESAIAEAEAGAAYLRELHHHPRVRTAVGDSDSLHLQLDAAARALSGYARWLADEVAPQAAGSFACGERHFRRLLAHRHFLDVTPDQLHGFGRRLAEETEAEMERACRELTGDDDVPAALAQLRRQRPQPSELMAAYREAMGEAQRFVRDRDLATVPERHRLDVTETPSYLRHKIPFAAYVGPAPGDPDQQAYYYVTPPGSEDELAEHNHAGIALTSCHEAWPGHHLQFVKANSQPASRSLPRLLNASSTLYEGWALYGESLMCSEGFMQRPETELLMLRDRLWRALRVMLDVELHRGELALGEAAQRLVQTLGFSEQQARGELAWYTRAPAVPMGYATGWALIRALRGHVLGDHRTDLKAFHDRLLASGSVALPLALRHNFGEHAWQTARAEVFAEL